LADSVTNTPSGGRRERSQGGEFGNHVVTLTGEVDAQATRTLAEKIASSVPNVQQVVNELQIKTQKAT